MSQDSIFNNDDEDILNNQDLGSFLEDNDFKYLELNTTNKYGLENEIDKKNYPSNESTNENTNASFIVETISDFSNFVNELRPNNCKIIVNPNNESNENVGDQTIVNEENKFSQTITIKINSDQDSSFECHLKIIEDIIKDENDKLNFNSGDTYCHKRNWEVLNLLLNSVKQLDKSVYKLNYEILNSFKNLYIEFKINGYDNLSKFEEENKQKIKNGNCKRFLKIHSFKFGLDYLNFEIQDLNLNVGKLKDIKYIIKECIGTKMIKNEFAQTLETILNNPINKKEVNIFSGIKEDHNKKIIKQLKEINKPFITKLLNLKFSDIFSIYIFGNEELKNKNKNLSFLEDDLKDIGKYFTELKKLEKEEINKTRLMIKIFAYKFDLSNMKNRNRISDNLIKKLEDTNLYLFAKNIKQQCLAKKRKNN